MDPAVSLCTVPYWRQNLYNASACVPILLELRAGRLSALDRQGAVVFEAGVHEVSSSMTRLGTMILTVAGEKFSLTGRGARGSPAPSIAQLDHARRSTPTTICPPGFTPPPGANIVDAVLNGSAGFHMRLWHDALGAAGARSA